MTDLLPATEPPEPEAPPAPPPTEERPVFAPDQSPRRDIQPSTEVWHRDPGRASSPVRVLLITQLMICLAGGVFIGLVTLPRRPVDPLFVTVPVGEYEDPAWPVNPWANRDADLLADRFGGSGVKAYGFQGRERFRALLAWLGGDAGAAGLPQVERRRPLILHVSALGAVRGRAVFVVPADAPPDKPDSWVNVADILKAAAERRSPRTVLILDIARPAADPFGGNLGDDISTVLHDVLTAFDPQFPVFAACGPGEVSLPADAAAASAFAFYLAEGLGGAADGFEDPDGPDRELTWRELVRFTAARVDGWARRTHGRRQNPTLYGPDGRGTDFVLSRRPDWKPADPAGPPAYPDWVRNAAAERDGLRTTESARRDPVAFARLTAGFLSAEQRWHRPGTATRAEDTWRLARDEWGRATGRFPPPPDWAKLPAAADRFAIARAGLPPAPPELNKALTALMVAKPEQEIEAATAWGALAAPHRVAAVGLVWALAADTSTPTADMVARWGRAVELVDRVKPLAETRVVREVAARESFRRQKLSAYPSAAVAAYFRSEDALAALIALGPDQFHAVAAEATAALGEHLAGAERLLSAGANEHAQEAAAMLGRTAEELARVRERLGRIRAARNALDTAALVLGETLTGMTENDRPPSAVWFAVADAATRVAADGTASASQLDVFALVDATDQLVSGYGPAPVLKASAPDRRIDPRGAADLRGLLAGPALGGSGRVRMWDAVLADTARLHTFAREHESDPPQPVPQTDPTAGRKLRRAEASVRLLRLVGVPAADEADALLRKALAAGRVDESDRAWDAFGVRLRTAWLKELPDLVRAGGPAAERAARAVTPAAARYRAWADLPAPRPPDSPAAFRTWLDATPRKSDAKDSR